MVKMAKSKLVHIIILIISLALVPGFRPDRILFLLPITTQSQKNVFDPLIIALAERGHELTVVSSLKTSNFPTNSSVQEILISLTDDFGNILPANPFEFRRKGKLASIFAQRHIWRRECDLIYQHEFVQDIIHSPAKYKFDLIIMNGFFNQCMLGLVHVLHAPFIYVMSMASPLFITRYTGNYYPTSYVPLPFLDLSDQMTFTGRLYNYCLSYLANFLHDYAASENEKLYRQYLGQHVPGLNQIAGNMSLILSNEHFSITYPRPNLPDTVDIGGIHCRPPKNLTNELESFISGSKHGFIYFSMGSIVRSTHLSEEHRKIFINVFSRLNTRVIWKWDDENMLDVPPNVMVKKWLPQQDILGHPKIRLFITHGGLLSTQEAVYHGVGLIGIPFFVDQDLNMRHAESQGYALTLEIMKLSEDVFESSIRTVLSEARFGNKAKELSKIFRDQSRSPLDRAVFWTEYVLRHKGAPHLRSAARDMNTAQIHSWDVIGTLLLIVLAILFALKLIIFKTCGFIGHMLTKSPKKKLL